MAATKGLTKEQQERARAGIQTTQLVKRLNNFALDIEGVEIDPPRLKAIEILLRKSLPDLSAITLSGDEENPIVTKETGQGSAKVLALLDSIAERSGTAGEPDAG